ncbi:MAG TPA: acetyl-CoA carboxylase biotin carboxyl carrier protein [Aestuariivirgaceae bacterium]|nr:acetyl-CoA carboxylase biotin carboxyl carrier protein [Aestuariivirgaceae bacterium]
MPRAKSAIDKDLIRDLARLLDETGLGEIEIEQEGLKVRVARPAAPSLHMPAAAASHAPAAAAGAPAPEPRKPADAASHPGVLKSPMVGTAYCAPAPGAAPFVEPGGEVKEGQIILIIEAMKTMNQIPAPRSGRVIEILVTDGQPVEYGEPLLVIE